MPRFFRLLCEDSPEVLCFPRLSRHAQEAQAFKKVIDRTIMSPFCESAKMAAPPLNKFPCSKTAPPLPQTTVHVLTSLPLLCTKTTARPGWGLHHLSPVSLAVWACH
jgi:hypothetical protein